MARHASPTLWGRSDFRVPKQAASRTVRTARDRQSCMSSLQNSLAQPDDRGSRPAVAAILDPAVNTIGNGYLISADFVIAIKSPTSSIKSSSISRSNRCEGQRATPAASARTHLAPQVGQHLRYYVCLDLYTQAARYQIVMQRHRLLYLQRRSNRCNRLELAPGNRINNSLARSIARSCSCGSIPRSKRSDASVCRP